MFQCILNFYENFKVRMCQEVTPSFVTCLMHSLTVYMTEDNNSQLLPMHIGQYLKKTNNNIVRQLKVTQIYLSSLLKVFFP